ncbi:MAG: hypothetical protein ACOZNI_30870 [Myxococcota bacterium]
MIGWLYGCAVHDPAAEPVPSPPEAEVAPADLRIGEGLSDEVARVMDGYPLDGSYGFFWPPDDGVWWGTTRDVRYRKLLLSPGDPDRRSYCVGLTWEIAMQVLAAEAGGEDAEINGLTLNDVLAFRRDWFVRERFGAGAADAVVTYGLGERVPFQAIRRGDFLQMWTAGGAGHAGIFDSWVKDGERVVGVRYWSTHPLLGGIGYWSDSFGQWGLARETFFAARLARREDWVARGGATRHPPAASASSSSGAPRP